MKGFLRACTVANNRRMSIAVTLWDPAVVKKILDLSGVMATPQGKA